MIEGEVYAAEPRKREVAIELGMRQKKVIRFPSDDQGWYLGEKVRVYVVRGDDALVPVDPEPLVVVTGVTLD